MHFLHRFEYAMQKLRRCTGSIHGREETGPSAIFHELHRLHCSLYDLIMAHLDGMSDLNIGGGTEDMDQVHLSVKAGLSVLLHYAGETADLSFQAGSGDLAYAIKLALRGYGKTSLNNIYTEFVKLPGDLDLLLRGERDARSLLSIAKGGIKNAHFFINKRMNVVEDDSPQRFLVSCFIQCCLPYKTFASHPGVMN